MSLPDPQRLTEAMERGRLTPQELAELHRYLAQHPEERAAWEEDLSLNELLQQIPDAPLSSNFTAQVLQAVRAESQVRSSGLDGPWRSLLARHWIPKLATALSVLAVGLFAYNHHQEVAVRRELARNLAEISKNSGGATLELLQNFEAIQSLGAIPQDTDKGLIAALQ